MLIAKRARESWLERYRVRGKGAIVQRNKAIELQTYRAIEPQRQRETGSGGEE